MMFTQSIRDRRGKRRETIKGVESETLRICPLWDCGGRLRFDGHGVLQFG